MSMPFQLSLPAGAQVFIHKGSAAQLSGHEDAIELHVLQSTEPPKRNTLRLAMAALLLFGGGYVARFILAPDASAQGPLTASLGLPPSPDLPTPPTAAVLANTPGLPSSIHLSPPPLLAAPGQAPAQFSNTSPNQTPGVYGGQWTRSAPGMAVRAPFPVAPDAPQTSGQASAPGTGTSPGPRNPFGLE